MGLFDSATPTSDEGSSAEIAKWLRAPVALVVDASGMARSVAAMAAGYAHFDPELRVAGIICNRVGSRGHLDLLRAASSETPVLGGLPEDPSARFSRAPSRPSHRGRGLGSGGAVRRLGKTRVRMVGSRRDHLAGAGRARIRFSPRARRRGRRPSGPRCTIGLAFDDAFHFYYEDNLSRLEALGARIVKFSPCARCATAASRRTLLWRRISRGLRARVIVESSDARSDPRICRSGTFRFTPNAAA